MKNSIPEIARATIEAFKAETKPISNRTNEPEISPAHDEWTPELYEIIRASVEAINRGHMARMGAIHR